MQQNAGLGCVVEVKRFASRGVVVQARSEAVDHRQALQLRLALSICEAVWCQRLRCCRNELREMLWTLHRLADEGPFVIAFDVMKYVS